MSQGNKELPASSPQVSSQPPGGFNQPAQVFFYNKWASLETGVFSIKKKKIQFFFCFLLKIKEQDLGTLARTVRCLPLHPVTRG